MDKGKKYGGDQCRDDVWYPWGTTGGPGVVTGYTRVCDRCAPEMCKAHDKKPAAP